MSAVRSWAPLDELLAKFRPGSNPPPWSWDDEERMLLSACCLCCGGAGHYQRQLEAHIAEHGLDQGVCLGDDGRVWDGHHRIIAARRLGIQRIPLESPEDAKARWLRDHPQPAPLVNGYTDRPVESWKQWNPRAWRSCGAAVRSGLLCGTDGAPAIPWSVSRGVAAPLGCERPCLAKRHRRCSRGVTPVRPAETSRHDPPRVEPRLEVDENGRPDHQAMIRQLAEAMGLDLPALSATPEQVWSGLLDEIERRTRWHEPR